MFSPGWNSLFSLSSKTILRVFYGKALCFYTILTLNPIFFLLFFNYLQLSSYVQLRFISKQRKSICQRSVLMYTVRVEKEGQNTIKAKAEGVGYVFFLP